MWETRHTLVCGFRRDSDSAPPLVQRIADLCRGHLQSPGPEREVSALVLGRLLTRHDAGSVLADFLAWAPAAAGGDSPDAAFLLPGLVTILVSKPVFDAQRPQTQHSQLAWRTHELSDGRITAATLSGQTLQHGIDVDSSWSVSLWLTLVQPRPALVCPARRGRSAGGGVQGVPAVPGGAAGRFSITNSFTARKRPTKGQNVPVTCIRCGSGAGGGVQGRAAGAGRAAGRAAHRHRAATGGAAGRRIQQPGAQLPLWNVLMVRLAAESECSVPHNVISAVATCSCMLSTADRDAAVSLTVFSFVLQARKLLTKLATHMALALLPPRPAAWRYRHRNASLHTTLQRPGPSASPPVAAAATGSKTAPPPATGGVATPPVACGEAGDRDPAAAAAADEVAQQDAEAAVDISQEVEDIIGWLLQALQDPDTVVRHATHKPWKEVAP